MNSFLDRAAWNRPSMKYAWSGSSVLIISNEGTTDGVASAGLYFRLARFLSRLGFEIEGEIPTLASIAQVSPHELEASYVFPPVTASKEGGSAGGSGTGGAPSEFGLLTRTLDIMVRYVVHPGSVDVIATITNRWDDDASFEFRWLVDADYAGVGEVLSGERQQQAGVSQDEIANGLELRYEHPDLPFRTTIAALDEIEWSQGERELSAELILTRQESVELHLRIEAADFEDPISESSALEREKRREAWKTGVATVSTPSDTPLAALVNRSMDDVGSMALMEGAEEEWLYPGAGVPLYQNVWARDALTTTWQAGGFDRCEMLSHVLTRLKRLQGERFDGETDEQPGRILNREQPQPTSRLGIDPFSRYYADFVSPFMYVIGLGQFFAWTGDKETLRVHWESAARVLDWARTLGDRDGDGYLEYLTEADQGPKHQGWKDADNAVVQADGSQVQPPVATCEAQAYWFASLQFMAVFGAVLGEFGAARSYWKEATSLKERFNRDFWMEDEGSVAYGLGPDKKLIRSVTSNVGHCLTAGILAKEYIERQANRLFEPDMFSGWGIRTLSDRNPSYNPLSYHLGSVWPVENGTIVFGLRRYGIDDRVVELSRALHDLALLWPGGRTPECVGGYPRSQYGHPGAYPQANAPQAWNQSIWPLIMQSLLGLQPAATIRTLAVDPILPEWLPEVTLRDLRVGEAKVSIRFWRKRDGSSTYKIISREGRLRVIRQPPLNDLHASLWSRLTAAVTG